MKLMYEFLQTLSTRLIDNDRFFEIEDSDEIEQLRTGLWLGIPTVVEDDDVPNVRINPNLFVNAFLWGGTKITGFEFTIQEKESPLYCKIDLLGWQKALELFLLFCEKRSRNSNSKILENIAKSKEFIWCLENLHNTVINDKSIHELIKKTRPFLNFSSIYENFQRNFCFCFLYLNSIEDFAKKSWKGRRINQLTLQELGIENLDELAFCWIRSIAEHPEFCETQISLNLKQERYSKSISDKKLGFLKYLLDVLLEEMNTCLEEKMGETFDWLPDARKRCQIIYGRFDNISYNEMLPLAFFTESELEVILFILVTNISFDRNLPSFFLGRVLYFLLLLGFPEHIVAKITDEVEQLG